MTIPELNLTRSIGAISILLILLLGSLRLTSLSGNGRPGRAVVPWQEPAPPTAQAKIVENKNESRSLAAVTVGEARARARILHDAFGGALLVMHRDYFRDDQKLKQPSLSLEDVFNDMAETHHVELRWLAVNAIAMNAEHKPQNEFEELAVEALSSGQHDFELVNDEGFQYAGSIPLFTSCLKCHSRSKTGNTDKVAGLVITIPIENK